MRHSWSFVGCDEGRGMYGVELYAGGSTGGCRRGSESSRRRARRFGIDRRTVKKMLSYSAPSRCYRRTKPVKRPKLDGFTEHRRRDPGGRTRIRTCRASLRSHGAADIRACYGTSTGSAGGYTIVEGLCPGPAAIPVREAFVPLHHPPGHSRRSTSARRWSEVGGRREISLPSSALILPHSNVWFVKAYPRETTDCLPRSAMSSAFAFLGGLAAIDPL